MRGHENAEKNRLYVIEPMPTPTGMKADHRLPLRAGDVEEFAWALATGLGAANGPKQGENGDIYKWIGAIARDLQLNKGASVVIAGDQQPAVVHALAHVMNASLGNVSKTVFYTEPIEANPVDQLASLQDLVKDLDAGLVDFHARLLGCLRRPEVRGGRWRLLECRPAWDGNPTAGQFLAFSWEDDRCARLLACVNYGPTQGQCYTEVPLPGLSGRQLLLRDLLSTARYERDGTDLATRGLYLDMGPWSYHVFEIQDR